MRIDPLIRKYATQAPHGTIAEKNKSAYYLQKVAGRVGSACDMDVHFPSMSNMNSSLFDLGGGGGGGRQQ